VDVARRLVRAQHPDLGDLPIRPAASGWDNARFRLGDHLALRLPRRATAAWLAMIEQRWLPELAPRLPLPVPSPVRVGVAGEGYPFRWSITPWLEGEPADVAPPARGAGEALARFLLALHQPAPAEAPRNRFRAVLAERREAFAARLADLEGREIEVPAAMVALWNEAAAVPIDAPRSWVHGDLHARNVLTHQGALAAVLDWGDVAGGDPAADLAAVWMLLPHEADRRAVMAAYPASEATWIRAHGWAVQMAVMVGVGDLARDPRMAAMGSAILARLAAGP
jgi:aminoglycoside phosphotransferase (APT) family kinase protein